MENERLTYRRAVGIAIAALSFLPEKEIGGFATTEVIEKLQTLKDSYEKKGKK